MKKLSTIIIAIGSFFMVTVANAGPDDLLDGIVALEACDEAKETSDRAMCDTFLVGVTATFNWQEIFQGKKPPFCIPVSETLSLNDYRKVYVDWMNQHPPQLHGNSVGLFAMAMNETFPCG
jgi:hypothetical protein